MLPYCSCIMDEVQKNIPLADFIEIGNTPGGINNDPRFIKAGKTCNARLPAGSVGSSSTSAAPMPPAAAVDKAR